MLRRLFFATTFTLLCGLLPFGSAFAALPAGFEVESLVSGLSYPTGMTFAPDGRIFVIEKAGAVRVIKNGELLATPLITLTDVNAYGDRGLLGIAVDPNFSSNKYLYLLYTYENTPGANFAGTKMGRLVRVTVDGDTADESTKVVVLGSVGGTVATPSCENYATTEDCIPSDSPSHSVGGLRFGPDGALYVSLGDGAHYDYVDPRAHRAQNIDSLAGKILRIHTDGTGYTDNPFYNGNVNANRSKVYAYGVRNSYRFNFRPGTGALYVGDVGWNTWEEINKVTPGKNYGWPCREGNGTNGYGCDVTPHEDPLYTYEHNASGAGSVAAGDFPTAYPAEYNNSFFFGDYAQNWIKRVVVDASDNFVSVQDFMGAADGTDGPVALDRGPDGNIYFISIYTGELKHILYTTGNRQPIAQMTATPTNGLAPLTVNFSGAASSDPDGDPLSFSWNFGDGTNGTGVTTTHTYATNGSHSVVLTVTDGNGGLSTRTTTITVGNQTPTAVISSPVSGSLYRIGDMIDVEGTGTDPEDGTLVAPSQFFWEVILHHNTHTHLVQTMTGLSPSFPALDHSGASDIYTEIRLTVTDSGGLTDTTSINLYLNNSPTGGGNLVQNPSLETAVPGAPDAPQYWRRGGWGVLNIDYAYPVAGLDGEKAAQITVANYASGDAKWMHDPVSVDGNTLYTFRGNYKSTATAELLVQNGNGTGAYTYDTLSAFIPAAASWTPLEYTFTTPADGTTAVVALLLARNGTLAIDNFTIVEGTGDPGDTTSPTVSVTSPTGGSTVSGASVQISADASDASGVSSVQFFVDSVAVHSDGISPYGLVWDSTQVTDGTHTIYAVAQDSAGNTGTSATITITVNNSGTPPPPPGDTNLIENASFETEAGGQPTNWLQGRWGTNTTTFSYPVTGSDGVKAARVSMTAYTSGDAKWYFTPEAVTPGITYTFKNQYQATVPTTITVQYTRADGTNFYAWLADLPAAAAWTPFTSPITIPSGAVSMSVFHHINAIGSLTVDDYELFDPSAPPPPPPPSGDNLVVNGDLEIQNGINPANWTREGYGNNTATYTYPVTGHDGGKAAQIQLTNYIDGAAYLVPEEIPMQAGKEYTFRMWYKGTTITDVIGRYILSDGSEHYVGIKKEIPASASWTEVTATFVPPNSAVSLTPRYMMTTNGTFAFDDLSLSITGDGIPHDDITPPTVSITDPNNGETVSGSVNVVAESSDNVAVTGVFFAVDGTPITGLITAPPYTFTWDTTAYADGTHTLKATTHDAAGNNAATTISVTIDNSGTPPPPPGDTNLIENASFETEAGGQPTNWLQGRWGTNTTTFSYPVTGSDGVKAARVSMTAYTSGDAKWYFTPEAVTPGITYTFKNQYQATVPTTITVQYTRADGTNFYAWLADLPAAAAWTPFTSPITIPSGAVSMSVFHHINAIGSLTVDDYELSAP